MAEAPACTLTAAPPDPLEIGPGTVVYVEGRLANRSVGRPVALRIGPVEEAVSASGLPEPGSRRPGTGFLGFVEISAATPTGAAEVVVVVEREGDRIELAAGNTTLVPRATSLVPPAPTVTMGGRPLIAVCMATWEPEPKRFADQVDSLRAQTWQDWICVISDDASSTAAFAALEEVVGGDSRFVVSRTKERRGFYSNFERAIRMAPVEAELIALSDQDDRWDDDKLEVLAERLLASPHASLAYSDNRIRFDDGSPGLPSAFTERRNTFDDLASLLVANTVTGAASIFRRELLEIALPFPPAPGAPYHDHWLALCALASGEIAYLDRPTYDRIRHPESVTMLARGGRSGPPSRRERRRIRLRKLRSGSVRAGWRPLYFNRYLRIAHFARVLELRLGEGMPATKRRALRRLIAADRSLAATAWLAARSLRPLIGRDETFGIERSLVAGLIWRRTAGRRS